MIKKKADFNIFEKSVFYDLIEFLMSYLTKKINLSKNKNY